jgi:hypothetical protein
VETTKVLLLVRIQFAQGIKQAASAENFGAKLSAICAGFQELLQQYGNSHIAVAGRRSSLSIPARKHVVGGAADSINGVPNAHSHTRTKNQCNGFRFRRNENLTGMKKMSIRRRCITSLGGRRRREVG